MVDFQSRDTRRDTNSEEPTADDPDHEEHDHEDHDHHAHDKAELGVAIVTISSSRTREDDPSGDLIAERLGAAGHEVAVREIVRDNYDGIQSTVDRLAGRSDVECIVTTGGTGVTPDDVTTEAVESLFDKELPGFGELFRLLSYDEVGTKAICSRATAGIVDEVPVFSLPGSENAARLGVEELVVPEVAHLAGLASR